jgi:DNA-binding NtrC family response regulator
MNMKKIVVVDDEEHIRQLYQEELSAEGYEVLTIATGHGLLGKIRILHPDVLVLDIKLVDYDGLELLQQIRNQYLDLPVILCSAYDTYKQDPKAFAADYYVVKSFDLTELKIGIRRALESDHWLPMTVNH